MTIDEMKQRKRELGYTNAQLATLSGVPEGTVNKIFSGITKAPRRDTVMALESVLRGADRAKANKYSYNTEQTDTASQLIAEPDDVYQAGTSPRKKRPGEYTLEDYLALPDDVRVELIDGYFYDMAAPTTIHQVIIGEIHYQMKDYVRKNKGPCKPFISPIDVQVDKDDRTVVQPDIIVLCDPMSTAKRKRIFGAPDLVIEVLSPSTGKRDMTIKLAKYSESGVREVWYVDPDKQRVAVYILEGEDLQFPTIYTFEGSIPVHIWNNEFAVDFTKVYEEIKDYLES